jgi:hypothetical protein
MLLLIFPFEFLRLLKIEKVTGIGMDEFLLPNINSAKR